MITFRIRADVKGDRRVVLTLPADVPTGEAELVVTVESPAADVKRPRPSQRNRSETQPLRNGKKRSRYPLRGSVARYDHPTEPVADAEWEALG